MINTSHAEPITILADMFVVLALALAGMHDWERPSKIQPLDVPHRATLRHRNFLKHMAARHQTICPTLQRANRKFGAVTIMTVNSGQLPLLRNFFLACQRRSIPCREMVFVFALDRLAADYFESHGVAHYHYKGAEHPTAAKYFSDRYFAAVVFYKNAVVYDALSCGVNVLFQDVDLVWREDPIPSLATYNVDISFMNDGNSPHQQPIYINSGFFLVRHNERTLALWKEAFQIFDMQNSQQALLKQLIVHHYFNNNLTLFILPPVYQNGNTWGPTDTSRFKSKWIVTHASWAYNMSVKISKLKAIGEWYVT